MSNLEDKCASLRAQIAATEAQLAGLKRELASAQETAAADSNGVEGSDSNQHDQAKTESRWPLLQEEYKRYGRQMIVSQVGLEGEFPANRDGLARRRGSYIANNAVYRLEQVN
jgi:adenylyltransferase/sulfurtransferase